MNLLLKMFFVCLLFFSYGCGKKSLEAGAKSGSGASGNVTKICTTTVKMDLEKWKEFNLKAQSLWDLQTKDYRFWHRTKYYCTYNKFKGEMTYLTFLTLVLTKTLIDFGHRDFVGSEDFVSFVKSFFDKERCHPKKLTDEEMLNLNKCIWVDEE